MKRVRTSSFFQKESEEHPFSPEFGGPVNDELKELFHDAEAIRNRWFVIFGLEGVVEMTTDFTRRNDDEAFAEVTC